MLLDWDDLKGRLDRDSLVAGNLPFNYVKQPIEESSESETSSLSDPMDDG